MRTFKGLYSLSGFAGDWVMFSGRTGLAGLVAGQMCVLCHTTDTLPPAQTLPHVKLPLNDNEETLLELTTVNSC